MALTPAAPARVRRPRAVAQPLPADRAAALERLANEVAASWVASYLESLSQEGRPIEGGWPGTMPEARMRMDDHARHLLTARSMDALTTEELGQFTRIVYDEARRSWLRHRSPVPSRKSREP